MEFPKPPKGKQKPQVRLLINPLNKQRDRRNATDADLLRWVAELDKRKTKAEAGSMKGEKQSSGELSSEPSRNKTAAVIGTSSTKVQKARTIIDHADPKTKEDVLSGRKSILAALSRFIEGNLKNTLSFQALR